VRRWQTQILSRTLIVMSRRDWITTVLDVHTADLAGLEQCRSQIRLLGSVIEVLMDMFDQMGIVDRSTIELRVEQFIAAKAATERAQSMHAPAVHGFTPVPSYGHVPEPMAPLPAASVHSYVEQQPAYVYGAPPAVAPPMSFVPVPAVPQPAPPPAMPRTVSSHAQRPPTPSPAPTVPAPAGSAFVACAVCKKRVLRASTNTIAGVGDVCDTCLGAT
jgi:hypothetical protein